jgi:hypothetical protein
MTGRRQRLLPWFGNAAEHARMARERRALDCGYNDTIPNYPPAAAHKAPHSSYINYQDRFSGDHCI